MPDIWMDVDIALASVPVNIMPLIDDTDFKTREVAIAYNAAGMDLVWNFVTTGGVMTQTAVTPTSAGSYDWNHVGDGMYTIEIPASGGASINNDTEGFGWFSGICTGVLPWRGPIIGFRSAAMNNLMIDGGTIQTNFVAMWDGTGYAGGSARMQVDVQRISGDTAAADNLEAVLDGTGGVTLAASMSGSVASVTGNVAGSVASVAGNVGGNVVGSVGSVTGAVGSVTGNVGGNVTGSVGSVAGAVGSVTGNVGGNVVGSVGSLATQAKADVNAEVDTALTDIHLDHLLATDYNPAAKPGTATALLNELIESDAGVSRFTANALEQGPSGGGGGGAGSGIYPEPFYAESPAGTPIDGVYVAITTDSGGANVVASGFTDAFGLVTFNLDAGTYYVNMQRAGHNFPQGTVTVPSS